MAVVREKRTFTTLGNHIERAVIAALSDVGERPKRVRLDTWNTSAHRANVVFEITAAWSRHGREQADVSVVVTEKRSWSRATTRMFRVLFELLLTANRYKAIPSALEAQFREDLTEQAMAAEIVESFWASLNEQLSTLILTDGGGIYRSR